ncbi:flagellar protein FliT [Sporolactobacillus pectinivorans]|uniref:flagellar protein FliT n=1 Tax=Sporolactobacillus pectinivorans TaxID=1591408 RepID=UPI0012FD6A94|nr:flagellar protein FliT [Sporolactobacillus pectinivorans]
MIEEIKKLLNARQAQLALLSGKRSDEDKAWGEKITALNQKIDVALENIKQDIVKDMHHLNKTKKVIKKYRNPYQGPTKDGMFLDKKE